MTNNRHKYLSYDPEDVAEFVDEESFYQSMDDSDTPKPIFVKFYEQWCEHCKRLKEVLHITHGFHSSSLVITNQLPLCLSQTFQMGATYYKDRYDTITIPYLYHDFGVNQ
jgi:thiol-disulfide isomerase/thioredoxin